MSYLVTNTEDRFFRDVVHIPFQIYVHHYIPTWSFCWFHVEWRLILKPEEEMVNMNNFLGWMLKYFSAILDDTFCRKSKSLFLLVTE